MSHGPTRAKLVSTAGPEKEVPMLVGVMLLYALWAVMAVGALACTAWLMQDAPHDGTDG